MEYCIRLNSLTAGCSGDTYHPRNKYQKKHVRLLTYLLLVPTTYILASRCHSFLVLGVILGPERFITEDLLNFPQTGTFVKNHRIFGG